MQFNLYTVAQSVIPVARPFRKIRFSMIANKFREASAASRTISDAMAFQSAPLQALSQGKSWSLSKEEEIEVKNLTIAASGN